MPVAKKQPTAKPPISPAALALLDRRNYYLNVASEGQSPFNNFLYRRRAAEVEAKVTGRNPMTGQRVQPITGEPIKEAPKPAAAPAPAAAPTPEVAPVAPTPVAEQSVTAAVPPPVAVTDPASQISPEEQAARLRARLLLAQGGGKGGRLAGLSSSQLGYRTLSGFGA